jgi:hypothetical protein
MSSILVLLGQLSALEELAPTKALGKTGGMLVRDILLIVGAILVLSLILVFWARNITRRKRHRRHSSSRAETSPATPQDAVSGGREHRHHRRRRQRRDHRGRNPTLDETGGLPPLRNESSATPRP